MVDNFIASKQITEHLLALGYRRIAYISGPMRYSMSRERRAGYIEALADIGISVNESMMQEGDFTPNSGYQSMQSLLSLIPRPDAVVCANDQSAVGAIHAIKEAGLSIPGEIAVTGFDNSFPSTLISPAITTISVPREQMGQLTVSLLIDRIGSDSITQVQILTLDTQLVVRESTNASIQSQWELHGW